MMTHAEYGRMKIGRCVVADLGQYINSLRSAIAPTKMTAQTGYICFMLNMPEEKTVHSPQFVET